MPRPVQLPTRLRRHLPLLVLASSVLLTLAASLVLRKNARTADQARFDNVVQTSSDRIERRLDAYEALLRSADGMFSSQRDVTPEEFEKFVKAVEVQQKYPGIQGIGFTMRFSRDELPQVERWARTEGRQPEFRVWPDPAEDEVHSIVMLEPLDARNQAAIGYNMYSEPVRREAMSRARDTGQPALSGKVTLKQEIDRNKQPGFLLYMPVYAGAQQPDTVEARRRLLRGFVYSPFRAADLLTGIFGTERTPRAAFQLYDGTTIEPDALLYSSHDPADMPRSPQLKSTVTLILAGRPWTLEFVTLPAFEETASGRMVLPFTLAGLLFSFLLFVVTRSQVQARTEAERTAGELRSALEERARIAEQLQEADRRKDEFLAMLAHELRNPMAPVLTAVQLMRRKMPGEAAREREIIERQVHHMRRLVDDLLDVSRVTRGKIQLKKVPLDLVEAAERAIDTVRPFAEERRHTVRAQLPRERLWIEADPVRIEQVLSNLLHNAAKYSEPGGTITLKAWRQAERIVVQVVDTGVGISAEALPKLFAPFVQIGQTLDRAQGGLGLGLALVRSLVEMHGGRVTAASDGPGKGSAFTVELPALAEERTPRVAPRPRRTDELQATPGRRVLVVDDNLDAAELLGEVLELDGHEVAVVHDGLTALQRLASFRPDVVFLDIGLPGLDGYEVARRIRQNPDGLAVRLVAITGYGQATDRQRAKEAGFDAHLVKPVELDEARAQARERGPMPQTLAGDLNA